MLRKRFLIVLLVLAASILGTNLLAQSSQKLSQEYPLHFQGLMAGANCELKYELNILENKTYLLKIECSKNADISSIKESGKWYIDEKNRLLLKSKTLRYFSIINESTIELMDLEGNKIDSELNYKLELLKAPLQNTYWKLIELNQKPLAFAGKREAHIVLDKDSKIKGHSGCNSFSGKYELEENRLIISGPMMMTRMFCRGSNELEFTKALHSMQTYKIIGENLEVFDANKSKIAEFESVYLY